MQRRSELKRLTEGVRKSTPISSRPAPAAGPIIVGGARQGWNENDVWERQVISVEGCGSEQGRLRVQEASSAQAAPVHCDRFALTPDMRPAAGERRSMLVLLRTNGRRTMETVNQTSAVTPRRRPWNKGKLIGPKPPLQPKHIWAIRTRLQLAGRTRDVALFNLAIDSKLRGCDLVSVRVEDVAPHGYAVDRATVRQTKTGLPVRFEITEQTRQAIDEHLAATRKRPGDSLFSGRGDKNRCLSTRPSIWTTPRLGARAGEPRPDSEQRRSASRVRRTRRSQCPRWVTTSLSKPRRSGSAVRRTAVEVTSERPVLAVLAASGVGRGPPPGS
jgi:hypothetical protein